MRISAHIIAHSFLALSLCSCGDLSRMASAKISEEPVISKVTNSQMALQSLPPPAEKVAVTIYNFSDQTGQNKPSADNFPEYSKAVTQGALLILTKALLDTSKQSFFTVIERQGLNNLIQERNIIRMMRDKYQPDGNNDVGPLLYAGIMLEGGIVAYDSNLLTGGAGARYLGIGGDTKYRCDAVTVSLRMISTKTGEILAAVSTEKSICSYAVNAGIYKYVAYDKIFDGETGFTVNEPPQMAVRQAIELAVYALVMEGIEKGFWNLQNYGAQTTLLSDYLRKRDGVNATLQTAIPSQGMRFSPAQNPGGQTVMPGAPIPVAPQAQPYQSSQESSGFFGSFFSKKPEMIQEPRRRPPDNPA